MAYGSIGHPQAFELIKVRPGIIALIGVLGLQSEDLMRGVKIVARCIDRRDRTGGNFVQENAVLHTRQQARSQNNPTAPMRARAVI